MKRILNFFWLLLACTAFSGCPYESEVPIDNPSIKVNPKLLATWEDTKNHDVYKVTKHDDFTYSIEQVNTKENSGLLAFESLVEGVTFLNIWDASTVTKKYSLYKIDSQPDGSILLSEVTENIAETFSSGAELKKFISANMKNSYFFGKEKITLTRKGN